MTNCLKSSFFMVTFFQRVRNTFTPTERSQWMREWLQPWLGLDSSDRSIDQLHWDADFVLSNSSCRYPWNFFVHDGKSSASSGKGVGYTSVIRLLDGNVLGEGYRLYGDNIYTSPTLFSEMLKNSIFAWGTLSQLQFIEGQWLRWKIRKRIHSVVSKSSTSVCKVEGCERSA